MNSLNLKLVWQTFGLFKRQALILGLLIVASGIFAGIGLALILPILDLLVETQTPNGIVAVAAPLLRQFSPTQGALVATGMLFVAMLLQHTLQIVRAGYSASFTGKLALHWREKIYETYLYGDRAYLLGRKDGELINIVSLQPVFASKLITACIEFASAALFVAVMLALMLVTSWQITLVVAGVFGGAYLLVNGPLRRVAISIGRVLLDTSLQVNSTAAETVSGIREIRTFSAQPQRLDELMAISLKQVKVWVRNAVVKQLPAAVNEMIIVLLLVGGLVYVVLFTSGDLKSLIPTAGLFFLVARRLSAHISSLVRQRINMVTLFPSFKLVNDLIALGVERERPDEGETFTGLRDDIVFEQVCFEYVEDEPVLTGVDFRIEKGKITGLIGPSGSGKSTLVDLVVRLLKPKSGRIVVSGRDLAEFSLNSWRNAIGYVGQETFLFHASVRDNLLLGKPQASDEELIEAAKEAHAYEFITHLEDGFDTIIGTRGGRLSGGQRQRLAIARSLVRDPDVIVFDEATSSLDPDSKAEIFKILVGLKAIGKTILLVTHNRADLTIVDRVFEMDPQGGKVQEIEHLPDESGLVPIAGQPV